MRRLFIGGFVLVAALAVAAPARPAAQQTVQPESAGATIASVRALHGTVTGFIVKAAAMVPEETYKYQPTPEVRTMGQLFGHIANASRMFCGTATGMTAPEAPNAEELASKAEIQKALDAAVAFCNKAFDSVTPANANEAVTLFGTEHTRLGALAFNNAHNYEHYGNIVTYMRINGMVPPSSGGGQP